MSYSAYSDHVRTRWDEVGSAPVGWEARRLKFSVSLRNEKIEAEFTDLEYMGLEHIESWTGRRIDDEAASSEGIATRFLKNDVLFGKLRPYLAKVYLADEEGMATTEALVLMSESVLAPAFLKYVLLSEKFIDAVSGATFGAKMPRANWETIGGLPILLPTIPEQRQIAAFLDWKTIQIDALIAKKQELLEKLKEKRLAVITQAVTKGLNPDAPMRNPGITWLGEVPKHWDVKRFKFIAATRYGLGEPPEYVHEGLNLIRATDISKGLIARDGFKKIREEDVPWDRNPSLKRNEIIVVRSGAYTGDSAIVPSDLEGSIAGFDMVVTATDINPGLLAWALLSPYLLEAQIYQARLRAAQPHLNAQELGSFMVVVPPKLEQQKIITHIERNVKKIDQLLAHATKAVGHLNEYRAALITSATTGKIDLRNVVIPALN